ncbi:hypothetical protein BU14_0171s0001 [Porphyra umbilicalis]|uniref:Uncharacterized protein n=1 Tax=Porphyra umbilicalis TaxID=2786 RepID=A0A1X6P7I4_PORUM|nr:hypothetical protein BU14_0171s0001 [Porphyra umbilicalis]|eukprot:OSX76852.1 hypothetical protein BU14_0171s0001 [Porphyra umbilicalis]
MADVDDPISFLGFGAFETTAFCVALLVGLYSFIKEPTGRQDARDVSEIHIYSMWRSGVVIVFLDMVLKAIVLTLQVKADKPARTVWWTLALMVAPWAPFADKVARGILAFGKVRRLMLARVARNEVSCVLREFLRMGHQSLDTASVAQKVTGVLDREAFLMPTQTLEAVVARNGNRMTATEEYQKRVDEVMAAVRVGGAAWTVTRRSMRSGPKPDENIRHHRRMRLRRMDPWTRMWSQCKIATVADPFPPSRLAREDDVANAHEDVNAPALGRAVRKVTRAYILDQIDECNGSQTLSDLRAEESLPEDLCDRCNLAVRAAVETFFESSLRGHMNVSANQWLYEADLDYHGRLEGIVDAMWSACFVDHFALQVADDKGYEEARNNASKVVDKPVLDSPPMAVTTRKFFVFLFLVARSLFGVCHSLEEVGEYVKSRLHSRQWWDDYWQDVVEELGKARHSNDTYEDWIDGIKTDVLRNRTIAEAKAIINILVKHPVRLHTGKNVEGGETPIGHFCNMDSCHLNVQTTLAVTKPADRRRPRR